MKKLIIVLVLLLAATALFAQKFDLGNFPAGKWLDPNYDAIWELSATNIKILDSKTGDLYCDFSTKTINGFKPGLEGRQLTFTFSCPETERTYTLKSNVPDTDVTLVIDREDKPTYTVKMKKQ
jgi:hypothetical protein